MAPPGSSEQAWLLISLQIKEGSEMKLADALLRRKELQEKVDQLRQVKQDGLFQMVYERRQVNDQVDDIQAKVPVLNINQVTAEYDYYANKLRLIDAAIQQKNWTVDIEVDDKVWKDYPTKA